MDQKLTRTNAFFAILIAAIAWFAVVLQFSISIPDYLSKGRTLPGALVQVFSYFTILSNILVAVSLTATVLFRKTNLGSFFSKASTLAAVAVYITIVGLVYNTVLRQIWLPHGLFKLANELLHLVVPIAYILYWLFLAPKRGLEWKQIPGWLIFPFVYMIYAILRGLGTGYYPYFFVDVKTYGGGQVALNYLILLVLFSLFSALFMFIGRKLQSRLPE